MGWRWLPTPRRIRGMHGRGFARSADERLRLQRDFVLLAGRGAWRILERDVAAAIHAPIRGCRVRERGEASEQRQAGEARCGPDRSARNRSARTLPLNTFDSGMTHGVEFPGTPRHRRCWRGAARSARAAPACRTNSIKPTAPPSQHCRPCQTSINRACWRRRCRRPDRPASPRPCRVASWRRPSTSRRRSSRRRCSGNPRP